MLSLLKQLPLFKRIFSNGDIQRPLGRWSLVDDSRKTYRRSELANEDHCGTCSEYINQQKEQKEIEEFYQIVIYSESVPDKHITNNKPP